MKKNNQEIMNRIYQLETQVAILKTVIYFTILLMIILLIWIFGVVSWEIITEQGTGDLFTTIFTDITVLLSIFDELPKVTLLLMLLAVIVLLILAYRKIKKRKTIITRINSLIHYWKQTLIY